MPIEPPSPDTISYLGWLGTDLWQIPEDGLLTGQMRQGQIVLTYRGLDRFQLELSYDLSNWDAAFGCQQGPADTTITPQASPVYFRTVACDELGPE